MTAENTVLPDITYIKDVSWKGPLPALLAPYVCLYGPLHVYANDVTGHLFIRVGISGEIAGAERLFILRLASRGARVYTRN